MTREAFPHFDPLLMSPAPLQRLRGTAVLWLHFLVFFVAFDLVDRQLPSTGYLGGQC